MFFTGEAQFNSCIRKKGNTKLPRSTYPSNSCRRKTHSWRLKPAGKGLRRNGLLAKAESIGPKTSFY